MGEEMFDAGMAMRRKVLGDDHVDRSLSNATELDEEFQPICHLSTAGGRHGLATAYRRVIEAC